MPGVLPVLCGPPSSCRCLYQHCHKTSPCANSGSKFKPSNLETEGDEFLVTNGTRKVGSGFRSPVHDGVHGLGLASMSCGQWPEGLGSAAAFRTPKGSPSQRPMAVLPSPGVPPPPPPPKEGSPPWTIHMRATCSVTHFL